MAGWLRTTSILLVIVSKVWYGIAGLLQKTSILVVIVSQLAVGILFIKDEIQPYNNNQS